MINIIGTHECKVDVKGRFLFPSSFKGQLTEELSKGFVIKRSIFRRCLELYPRSEWDAESEKVSKLNRFRQKNVDFIRKFMAGVKITELDSTGRLLIPRELMKFGNISREIVLASMGNRIEVWDKEAYEQAVDYQPEDFAGLAEEVMGDQEGVDNE
ncbi:MAG: division/cell wall cluster transcriptional repressor MraZ [Bacteroidales bacterium]|nr:division/cell wall cluster transcriptional repressor MraZ [Bacteroidales bacterium]MCF8344778.1 division/cell wall cluster transcriptional repressor MraZ [Bacteroidales bacterium]MCF8352700.1 division/cell wall cluster transcriptional repressor MraZ [Bacteroidales bacterium]MCF8377429.1 division/cell wall cluster transcriptional repressor MraZ [Bacteroidales bacterium]MCF8401641.1 division/cell wall cluster transcriptional repressor MraZ [Bacteroidales bacterium]